MKTWLKKIGGRNRSENIAQHCRRPQGQRAWLLCRATIGSVAICLLAGLSACEPAKPPAKPAKPDAAALGFVKIVKTGLERLDGEYIKSATMACGDAEVQSVIRCKKEPTYPAGHPMYCSDQYFVFRRAGKEKVVRPGKKVPLEAAPGGYHLLPKADNWLCAQGKEASYLLVTYRVVYNHGDNCDTTCNWLQIYDLTGRSMIDLTKNRRTDGRWKDIPEKRLINKSVFSDERKRVEQRLGISLASDDMPPEVFWNDSTYIPIRVND